MTLERQLAALESSIRDEKARPSRGGQRLLWLCQEQDSILRQIRERDEPNDLAYALAKAVIAANAGNNVHDMARVLRAALKENPA